MEPQHCFVFRLERASICVKPYFRGRPRAQNENRRPKPPVPIFQIGVGLEGLFDTHLNRPAERTAKAGVISVLDLPLGRIAVEDVLD
jgi:hypothetical protein